MNETTPPSPKLHGEILPLTFWPSKHLQLKSSPVPEEMVGSDELRSLVANMIATMYATGGVGLSAIQVGIPFRLFVLDPYHNVPGRSSQLRVCVNPVLESVEESEPVKMPEGCLSFPSLRESVERASHVRLRCVTHLGDEVDTVLDEWPSRIAQHEHDHLDGVLLLDKLSGLALRLAKKKLARFRRHVKEVGKPKPRRR